MNKKVTVAIAVGLFAVASNGVAQDVTAEPTSEVVLASDIKWKPLNPARGNNGPQAGTLWGDQTGEGPSGFLVKFVDGFASPAHIHNITYRGVVISGRLHNDDPNATPMWMPAGSYWTQPAGEPHITAASGASVAYVEIQEGPYLVLPAEKAADNGERPVNVDASNIVWLDASNSKWISPPAKAVPSSGAKIAFLWGKPQHDQINGTLIKLPAGFSGKIHSSRSTFRAVVIEGQPQVHVPNENETRTLEPGSFFGSKSAAVHEVSSSASEESIIYIRSDGKYEITTD